MAEKTEKHDGIDVYTRTSNENPTSSVEQSARAREDDVGRATDLIDLENLRSHNL